MAASTVNLSPANVPLIFTAGDDAEIPVRFGTTSGGVFTPYDLGDWEPTVHIRRQKTEALIDTLTIANGKIYLVETDTKMTLWVKAATTESLAMAKCEVLDYDLQITVNGKKRTYIAGTITLNKQITTG